MVLLNWLFSDLLVALLLLFISFVAHEAGHIHTAQRLGYKVKARFRKGSLEVLYWPNVTQADDLKVLNNGLLWGFSISLLSVLLTVYWSPLVLVLYFVGCRYDLKRVGVLSKHLNIIRTK